MQTIAIDQRPRLARRGRMRAAACLCVGALLAACAAAPPKPTAVRATLTAAAGVNPDVHQRPSPVVVRIFELKATGLFDAASFVAVYQNDTAALGAELVAKEEFVLRPGEKRTWEKTLGPETRFVGVIAAFRDIDRAQWKTTLAVKPNATNVMTLNIDEVAVGGTASVTP